jgi:hypothetical protein
MMPNKDYRIRGRRVANKNQSNGIYPKFTLNKSTNTAEIIIESSSELATIDANIQIYEPIETGLGTASYTMYVVNGQKTYLFHYKVDGEPTWGDEVVTFNDWMDFEGNLL